MIQIPRQSGDTAEMGKPELRGVVEHVGSGARKPFADTRELHAFLRADHSARQKKVEE